MITDDQLDQVKQFFGPAIDFSRVQIRQSPFCSGGRPWACGNVIRVKRAARGQPQPVETADLVHEFGHVWQHQRGQPVFVSAVAEQLKALLFRRFDPYSYGGAMGVQASKQLSAFLTESQAQIITELWKAQHGFAADRLAVPFTPDYVQNLLRLVQPALVSFHQAKSGVASRLDSAIAWLVNAILGIFERD